MDDSVVLALAGHHLSTAVAGTIVPAVHLGGSMTAGESTATPMSPN